MRTLVFLSSAVLLSFCAYPLIVAQNKEDANRRKDLEEYFAKIEPKLEKSEQATRRKQYISELRKHLESPGQVDLFQLKPSKDKEPKREFHGYSILSEQRLDSNEQRKKLTSFLADSLHWNDLRMALCFNPRHGLRVVSGKQTLDLLICLECNRIEVFRDGMFEATLATVFVEGNSIFGVR